jgi:hypothetical protein
MIGLTDFIAPITCAGTLFVRAADASGRHIFSVGLGSGVATWRAELFATGYADPELPSFFTKSSAMDQPAYRLVSEFTTPTSSIT